MTSSIKKNIPFWFITAAIFCALILPTLVKDGMFMDGLLYSCVAKNLADGIGSFWFPHFSKTTFSFFNQQPPLGFGIQALFFKVFGSSIYVERGYSFLMAIITAVLIAFLWKIIFKRENEIKLIGWLPVLYWITIPVCFWAYSNGVLENTMSVFDLLAVICIVKFFESNGYLLIIFSGIFIFLASLTKGIQGVFPLVTFFAGWVAYRNVSFWKMIFHSLLLLLIPLAIYFLLLQNNLIFESLNTYLNVRVLNSIKNVVEVENRGYLIYRLALELIPMIALSGILVLIKKKNKTEPIILLKNHILFFLLIGISGSFPLIVTLEQRGFYLVNSFPYFAIAIACFAAPYFIVLAKKINESSNAFKKIQVVSGLLLAATLTFSFLQIGKTSRDAECIHDVYLIGKVVPHGKIVGANYELFSEYAFQEYLIRHYYICVDSKMTNANEYIVLKSGTSVPDSIKIERINIPTIRYHLYKVKR